MLSTLSSRRPRHERLATRATFLCSGFATAAWASIIPLAKLNAQISDATLGYVGVFSSPAPWSALSPTPSVCRRPSTASFC